MALTRGSAWSCLVFLALLLPSSSRASDDFDPGLAGFAVEARGLVLEHRVMALFVMPGETVEFRVAPPAEPGAFTLEAAAGEVTTLEPGRWRWAAPVVSGLAALAVTRPDSAARMDLNVFVMVPMSRVSGGMLNGYTIGEYPASPLHGLDIYRAPPGLVEVPKDLADTAVSPHFTLGQFLCKEDGGWPRYLVLRTRLLQKLEHVLAETNRRGIACSSFVVMSGYRTPAYNRAIGNVKYSRHMWGGAADIYVDTAPADGIMDDLNGDGKQDDRDAAVLYRIVDDLSDTPRLAGLAGGLGRYRRTSRHGPFVHVDVRGFRARWGD